MAPALVARALEQPARPELLAVFERTRLAAVRAVLEARGGTVLVLRDEPVPAPSWSLGFVRASVVAATFGALAAASGALLGRGETALPIVGWLPSSVVVAAAFAGATGTLAFTLAFVIERLAPPAPAGRGRALCIIRGALDAAEARTLGGELLTVLPRAD